MWVCFLSILFPTLELSASMIIPCVIAYLDPGAGSMLLQAIVGGTAGMLVFVRHLWRTYQAQRGSRSPMDGR